MNEFIVRYRVTVTTMGGKKREKYVDSVKATANDLVLARQSVSDIYIDDVDTTYLIEFL